jgi:hypothetical protein
MRAGLFLLLSALAACDDDSSPIDAAVVDGPSGQPDAAETFDAAGPDASGATDAGGVDGGGGAAGTVEDMELLCTNVCAREAGCGESSPTCVDDCLTGGPVPEMYLHDFLVAYGGCIIDLSCAESEDTCLIEAFGTVDPDWQTHQLNTECMARDSVCGGTFSDDLCAFAAALSPAGAAVLDTCLDEDCAAISTCLQSGGLG